MKYRVKLPPVSARPSETSPLRRVLMQSIMWLILAATIGLAALVDDHKTRRTAITLGEPRRIDDFSMRFPADWQSNTEDPMEHDAALELREPSEDLSSRVIDVRVDRLSFFDVFSTSRKHPVAAAVPIQFGDQNTMLSVYRDVDYDSESGATLFVLRCEVSRPLSNGRTLLLRMSHVGAARTSGNSQREQDADIDLMKKMAATLVIQP